MKTSLILFLGLAIFYTIMTVVYWAVGGEAVGVACLALSAALGAMVAFYVWFTSKRIGKVLPEDNTSAEISDGAGELGFYSPHSWWPLPVGFFAVLSGLGLVVGWWLTVLAAGLLVASVVGFVTEYEKPASGSESH